MKTAILALLAVAISFGAPKEKTAPPPAAPTLTDAQKTEIALALYDNEALNNARAAISKAEQRLRTALAACGTGWIVTRDQESGELKCIAAPPAPQLPPRTNIPEKPTDSKQ